jgi:hypothetical protein
VDDRDAAVQGRGDEAGQIADHAAAEREERAAAIEAAPIRRGSRRRCERLEASPRDLDVKVASR